MLLVLTTGGSQCSATCHNRWGPGVVQAHQAQQPRVAGAEVQAGGGADGLLHHLRGGGWHLHLQGPSCPDSASNPRDERPGSQVAREAVQLQVGHIRWTADALEDGESRAYQEAELEYPTY